MRLSSIFPIGFFLARLERRLGMHPGFVWYWKRRLERMGGVCATATYGGCGPMPGPRQGWGEGEGVWLSGRHGWEEDPIFGAGFLGVRRPLRFLASRLDFSQEQFAGAAKILEELKIERAQAAVDLRRSGAELAQALEGSEFDRVRAEAAREQRMAAARRVQDAVARALEQLHGLLDAEQRDELATLIRSGAIRL